jgi:hypothetical protein
LLAWVLSFALVFAQTVPPDTTTVTVTTGLGDNPTVIDLLDWVDGRPTSFGALLPTLEYLTEEIPQGMVDASAWEALFVDNEGWQHHRVALPAPTGIAEYEVKFKADEENPGRTEVQFHPVGDPAQFANAEIVFPPGMELPAHAAAIIIIIIIIIIAIWACGKAQEKALAACQNAARDVCSDSGGVKSSRFFGICGQGSCRTECWDQ